MSEGSTYGQFCPVAQAAEILTERWTPLILRELLCGSHRFNDLHRGVPLMSPTLLTRRLRNLEQAGIVERRADEGGARGYFLTPAGEAVRPIVEQLGWWGQRWLAREVHEAELDPALLMWDMRRRIASEQLPDERVVLQVDFRAAPRGKSRWWLLLQRQEVDLCIHDPGHEVDLRLDADLRALTLVWTGDLQLEAAIERGDIEIEGPTRLRRALPSWLELSMFAPQHA